MKTTQNEAIKTIQNGWMKTTQNRPMKTNQNPPMKTIQNWPMRITQVGVFEFGVPLISSQGLAHIVHNSLIIITE